MLVIGATAATGADNVLSGPAWNYVFDGTDARLFAIAHKTGRYSDEKESVLASFCCSTVRRIGSGSVYRATFCRA